MNTAQTRRAFLRGSALAAGALAFPFVSSARVLGANGRLNLAGIGVGGKGWTDVTQCDTENIVALCDVDDSRAANTHKRFPDAKRFHDFRRMFDQISKDIDAVTVSTPDHMHFLASMWAIERGKHVYCQKPLTHTIEEARRLTLAAAKQGVATQMGNQGRSHPNVRRDAELVRTGVLGRVHEVHCWTDRPGQWWPQGVDRPSGQPPVPKDLAWDLWLGGAEARPYSPSYVPFAWRGFWDFGTGALGDMGCHLLNVPDLALEIRDATRAEAWSEGMTEVSGPKRAKVRWEIPARGARPAFTLWWYDGGWLPPQALFPSAKYEGNGVLIVGDQDVMLTNYEGGGTFRSGRTAADFKHVPETLPRGGQWDRSHYGEWIAACKGGPKTLSGFDRMGPMTEVVLLGNVALRARQPVVWDSKTLRVTNAPGADRFIRCGYRKGWSV